MLRSSHARVTSAKSVSFLNSVKVACARSWKSFHFRQSLSSAIMSGCFDTGPSSFLKSFSIAICGANDNDYFEYMYCIFTEGDAVFNNNNNKYDDDDDDDNNGNI